LKWLTLNSNTVLNNISSEINQTNNKNELQIISLSLLVISMLGMLLSHDYITHFGSHFEAFSLLLLGKQHKGTE
jgi:hypothetical protein